MHLFPFLFPGCYDDAVFVSVGKKRFLYNDAHRYYKNREINGLVHWRCVGYHRHNCRSRAITQFVNGRETVRFNYKLHTNDSELFYCNGI